ncbi:hypothetical protein FB451DRAFT_1131297 [Mycena latifolia]|nr:hypothetical protein FB451DRAFT_1131297 [Mycena latifolia]
MKTTASLALFVALATNVAAICPGFNFGIGNQMDLGNVYDDRCNQVDGLTTNQNPCTQGIFGCSPPPIIFNEYTSTFTGLKYACRTDPKSGSRSSDKISVCCRNDGK